MKTFDDMMDSVRVTDHGKPIRDIIHDVPTMQEEVILDIWKLCDKQLRPKFKEYIRTLLESLKRPDTDFAKFGCSKPNGCPGCAYADGLCERNNQLNEDIDKIINDILK